MAPPPGRYSVTDGKEIITLNMSDGEFSNAYRQRFSNHYRKLVQLCRQQGLHLISVATDQDLAKTLHSGLRGAQTALDSEGDA